MVYYHLVYDLACVAQLAEQLTRNEQVAGSNPATSSKKKKPPQGGFFLFVELVRSRSLCPERVNPATSSKKAPLWGGFFHELDRIRGLCPEGKSGHKLQK